MNYMREIGNLRVNKLVIYLKCWEFRNAVRGAMGMIWRRGGGIMVWERELRVKIFNQKEVFLGIILDEIEFFV
jgi:hypothetical protein